MKTQLKLFTMSCVLGFSAAILLLLLAGCASTSGQPSFQEAAYSWATNAVATGHNTVVPYLPAPYNGLLEGALAVSTGLLGLWGAKLHKNVTALNGVVNSATVAKPPAST